MTMIRSARAAVLRQWALALSPCAAQYQRTTAGDALFALWAHPADGGRAFLFGRHVGGGAALYATHAAVVDCTRYGDFCHDAQRHPDRARVDAAL